MRRCPHLLLCLPLLATTACAADAIAGPAAAPEPQAVVQATPEPPAVAEAAPRPSVLAFHCSSSIRTAEPLYIVDGVPFSQPLASLDPADIASIEVIKGASAAALYGSRAVDGVVIITTRGAAASRAAGKPAGDAGD